MANVTGGGPFAPTAQGTDAVEVVSICMQQLRDGYVEYPSFVDIRALITNAGVVITDKQFISLQLGLDRVTQPRLPHTLSLVIQQVMDNLHTNHALLPQLVAVTWAALRNSCHLLRTNALMKDRASMEFRIGSLSTNVSSIKTILTKLTTIYMLIVNGLTDAYAALTERVTALLPVELTKAAKMSYDMTETTLETLLPQFLDSQVYNMRNGGRVETSLEAVTAVNTWTKVTRDGSVQGALAKKGSKPSPSSPWASLTSKDTDDMELPVIDVVSTIEFTQDDITNATLAEFRDGLMLDKIVTDLANTVYNVDIGHLALNARYDEYTVRTSYIRVNCFQPITSLPDAAQNLWATLSRIKAILRAIGRFTGIPADPLDTRDSSGLTLDDDFMIRYFDRLRDVERDAVTIKLRNPAWFGVRAYGQVFDCFHVLPLVQQIPKPDDDTTRSGQFYYTQALDEKHIQRVIAGYRVASVVRGIPATAQCSPIMGACMLDVHVQIAESVRDRYLMDRKECPEEVLTILLATIPHYVKRTDTTTIYRSSKPFAGSSLRSLPDDASQIDEPIFLVVWLGGQDEDSQKVFNHFSDPEAVIQNVTSCGVPLELLPSIAKCRALPTYSASITADLYCYRIGNFRPGVPIREIILRLIEGNTQAFILSRAEWKAMHVLPPFERREKNIIVTTPSILVSIGRLQIPGYLLKQCAAVSRTGLVSLTDTSREELYGRGHLMKLHLAYAKTPKSRPLGVTKSAPTPSTTTRGTPRGNKGNSSPKQPSQRPSVSARPFQTPVGAGTMSMGAGLGTMTSPWAKPVFDTPVATGRTSFGGTSGQASSTVPAGSSPSSSNEVQPTVVTPSVSHPSLPSGDSAPSTPMDVSTPAVLKRTREDNPTNPISQLLDYDSHEHGDEDDSEGEVLSEAETTQLKTQNWNLVRRYEELLTECDVLEAKVTRLLQKLENNPDDEDVQDVIVGAQSSLQTKRQAMRRLFSTVEDNCQRLQEVIDIYLPYDHVT